MSVFFVANFTIIDEDKYNSYATQTRETLIPLMQKGKAKLLVSTSKDNLGTKEGIPANKLVLIEFQDREIAENWYHSDVYQKLIPMRQAATKDAWVIITDQFTRPS